MEKIKAPIAPLDESQLEKISGGEAPQSFAMDSGLQAYLLYSQLANAIITPLAPLIQSKAAELNRQDTKRVLATYYTSKLPMNELIVFYANSWNERHPGLDPIDAPIAACILALKDYPDLQADIALLGTRSEMVAALNKVLPGANLT